MQEQSVKTLTFLQLQNWIVDFDWWSWNCFVIKCEGLQFKIGSTPKAFSKIFASSNCKLAC